MKNFLSNLSDSKLRLLSTVVFLSVVATSLTLYGQFVWMPVLLALGLGLNAPRLKEAIAKVGNPWVGWVSVIGTVATLGLFVWVHQLVLGPLLAVANLPVAMTMQAEMQKKLNQRFGIKPPPPEKKLAPAKPKAVRPKTNTLRKWEARQAKKKK